MGVNECSVQMVAGLVQQQQVARNQSKSCQRHSGFLTKDHQTWLFALMSQATCIWEATCVMLQEFA